MALKVDGRPLKVDVFANPDLDAPGVSITGFPAAYLTGSTCAATVKDLAGTAAAATWTVTVGATSVLLSMPQSSVETIGQGQYLWTLVIARSTGGKPATIGGKLSISKDHKPTTSTASLTFESDPVGVDLVIEQVLADGLTIDGGVPAATGSDVVDGGAP